MSTEENKMIVRRLMDEFFARQHTAVWNELVQPEVVIHGVMGTLHGSEEAKSFYARMHAIFQPWEFTIQDSIAERDKVVLHITETGTMVGSLMGMPATRKTFLIEAVQIFRLVDGKIAEMWGFRDTGSQMRQLGLLPATALATR